MIHVSGDNRYELFVNGQRVATGPARGDLNHWRYETLDIAPQLQAGKNVLAAVVWNYAEFAPMAQMMNETGFIVQGDGADEAVVNTDASWKAFKDEGVQAIHYDFARTCAAILWSGPASAWTLPAIPGAGRSPTTMTRPGYPPRSSPGPARAERRTPLRAGT